MDRKDQGLGMIDDWHDMSFRKAPKERLQG